MTFYDLFRVPLAMVPDRPIVTYAGATLDYVALDARARELAGGLQRLGAKQGTRIALVETNHPAWVELYLASALLGATLVGVNYRAKASEMTQMLRSSEAEIVVSGTRYVQLLHSIRGELDRAHTYIVLGERADDDTVPFSMLFDRPVEQPNPSPGDHASLILFTSGTTTLPKTVEMTHDQLCAYVRQMADPPDLLAAPECTLLCAPLYHVAGFTSLLLGLFSGRRLVLIPQFDPDEWLASVAHERVTSAFLVPTMLKQVLDSPSFSRSDLSSFRRLSYGAAPMPVPLIRRAIEELPGVEFNNAYGQTETISTVTVLGPEDHRLTGDPDEIATKVRRLASVGRPLPSVEIRVVDDEGTHVEAGVVGEVCVGISTRLKPPRDTAPPREENAGGAWLHTGDLGYVDEGGYLFLTGRKGDLIIRGGENIAPREVESALEQNDEIDAVAVVGVPDEQWGESVAAFVVRRSGSTLGEADVVEFARQRLASYKKPGLVFFVDELPLTATGKVSRRALRDEATALGAHR